ncbi:hypothetical protein [Pikeienuella sp. HZG-20]|uniref:hypothetical protein n=1 Tax=Paludibacillus litoralis TaxID=3133267 RepID=UPI0030ECE5F0
MAIEIMKKQPPASVDRIAFWDYVADRFDFGRNEVRAAVEQAVGGNMLTVTEARKIINRIDLAVEYDVDDPLIPMVFGIVQPTEPPMTGDEIRDHFRAMAEAG